MMRGGPTSGGFPWRNEDRQRQSSQTTATTTDPLVPGFGESTVQPLVPAFGQRVQTVTSFTATSGSISSASDSQRKIDDAAQKMMERYDKDQNNLIEKSTNEWAELKIDSNQIDLNRNNVITLDEIKRYLTNQEKGLKPEQTVGKIFTTYTTTYEHLPEGVPSWFLDRDKDNDGQLTLIEFANDQPITKAVIGEFEGFLDLNNDGILTVEECYQALKAEEEAKQKAKQAEQVKSTGRSDPGRGDRGDRGDRGGRRGNSGGDRPRGGDRDQPWQPGSGSEQQQNSSS